MSEDRTLGNLGIIALKSAGEIGSRLDEELNKIRESRHEEDCGESHLMDFQGVRFNNGEGKIKIVETARGRDLYILADVGNYSCKYDMYGFETSMGPDEHFQDIKRTLSAIGGRARRVTVIMPLLYASRQHRRKGRESLDCALALQELEKMGVSDIITFDVHDPNIQNAIPLTSFVNIYPTYPIVKALLANDISTLEEISNTIVISPDTGAMDRAIYYAGVMNIDVGLFYKRRDFTRVVNGKNPIVSHEYMGKDIVGKNILIVDDMIASGESVLDIAKDLKGRGAKRIIVACSFALFTEGTEKFDKAFEENLIDRVYATNLTYVPSDVKKKDWFVSVDMSKYLAEIIDHLNYDKSIATIIDATSKIKKLMDKMK